MKLNHPLNRLVTRSSSLVIGILMWSIPNSWAVSAQKSGPAEAGIQANANCYAAYRIDKEGFREDWEDNSITFKVSVSNIGNCPLKGIVVSDFFPQDTKLIRAFPRPDFVGKTYATWSIPWLNVGEVEEIFVRFSLDYLWHDGWIKNNACAWNSLIAQQICAWSQNWVSPRSGPHQRQN